MISQTLYVHIGLHKTGTSSIQHFLNKNRKLFEKHNVYYPYTGCNRNKKSFGHHNIGKEFLEDTQYFSYNDEQGSLSDLIQEIKMKNYKNNIISSEVFSLLINNRPKLKEFNNILQKNFFVKYIGYYRKNRFAESLYIQLKKQKQIKEDFHDFLKQIQKNGIISLNDKVKFYYNHSKFKKLWEETTGLKLNFIDYDKKQDVLPDFFSIIQMPENIIIKSAGVYRANRTLYKK